MRLDDISLSGKLWGSTLMVLGAMFAVAATLQQHSIHTFRHAIEQVQSYESRINQAAEWRGMIETNVQRLLAITLSPDPVIAQTFAGKLKAGTADITVLQKRILESSTFEPEKAALERVAVSRAALTAAREKAEVFKKTADSAAVQAFVDKELDPAIIAYVANLSAFVKVEESLRDTAKREAEEASVRTMWVGLLSVGGVFAFCLVWTSFLVRSIRRPLARAVELAGAIADGDLTQRVDESRRDEIGQLMQAMGAMVDRLRGVVAEVREGVESVSTASAQIAIGNQDLSQRTENTASNLQETASSMEQLTATVSQSADTARQANSLAASAALAASRGGDVVTQVVQGMQNISASSSRIADIIAVIDSIAFQTNILALNAAVEAARAGEQGRGFAVVAAEVRNLARRSSEAAKEVKALINASLERVESGSKLVGEAGSAMGEIVTSVGRVTDLMGEICAAAVEQRDGIGQVNQAVGQLDQLTQQNAALVEESAAAASSLRDQAQRLSRVVAVFHVGTPGARAAADAEHAL